MDYMQRLMQLYDAHYDQNNMYKAGQIPLPPIAHTVKRCGVEVSLSPEGKLIRVSVLDKKTEESVSVIPAREDAMNRSNNVALFPLCEQAELLADSGKKKEIYLDQLKAWRESEYTHPIVDAVYAYMTAGHFAEDLRAAVPEEEEGKKKKQKPLGKEFVRWRIVGIPDGECWKNTDLMDKWTAYYLRLRQEDPGVLKQLDLVTGKTDTLVKTGSARGIIRGSDFTKSKLYSSNETEGFTFRNRDFDTAAQCGGYGYIAEQKIDLMLEWLSKNFGTGAGLGNGNVICFALEDKKGPEVPSILGAFGVTNEETASPADYRKQLHAALNGYLSNFKPDTQVMVIRIDTVVQGRMAVTYYDESPAQEYLTNLMTWDEGCSWYKYGKMFTPSLYEIALCAYGTEVDGILKGNDRQIESVVNQLADCRLHGLPMPYGIVRQIVRKAAGRYSDSTKERVVSAACAVLHKYTKDNGKEFDMKLEPGKPDRSYQYGRLLAVLEKAEKDSLKEQGSDRQTKAQQMMQMYITRPMETWAQISRSLMTVYLPKLSPGAQAYYQKLITEIVARIPEDEKDPNAALKDTWLLGYYLQRQDLYTAKNDVPAKTGEKEI